MHNRREWRIERGRVSLNLLHEKNVTTSDLNGLVEINKSLHSIKNLEFSIGLVNLHLVNNSFQRKRVFVHVR